MVVIKHPLSEKMPAGSMLGESIDPTGFIFFAVIIVLLSS